MSKHLNCLALAVLVVGLGGVQVKAQQPPPQPPSAPPPPMIVGSTSYKPHQLVKLAVVNVPKGTGYTWDVTPSAGVERATTTKDRLEFAAHPGVYSVKVTLGRVTPEGLELDALNVTVTVESCYPPEPPKPNPPGPTPPSPTPPGPKQPTISAIGQIQFGNSGCTATPIEPRNPDGSYDLLTAAHCVQGVGQRGTFKSRDGRTMAVVVTARSAGPDLAWLRTVGRGPDDLPMARLARQMPSGRVDVWHAGFGIDKPGNVENGYYIGRANSDGLHAYDLSVSSGDSGGSIIWKERDEVIGAVCCTSNRGAFARMYAGGADVAWSLRPRSQGSSESEFTPSPERWQWDPCEIPRISWADDLRRPGQQLALLGGIMSQIGRGRWRLAETV